LNSAGRSNGDWKQAMRVSFDSNAWERIFTPADTICAPIRAALTNGAMAGFICEAGFRIEAITKVQRASYFTQPHMGTRYDGLVTRDGREYVQVSFGPNDNCHPGLPSVQAQKLQTALSAGVLLMRGLNFMGLPRPPEILNPRMYIPETTAAAFEREQRQIEVTELIAARSVGKAAFDALGGWRSSETPPADDKKFFRACAEWADAELVAAHIAYKHDTLCTNDRARGAGISVFDAANRGWLTAQFGVVFKTVVVREEFKSH
jgi:hypothetical protein